MNVYEAQAAGGGIAGRPGCVGVVFDALYHPDGCPARSRLRIQDFRRMSWTWLVVKYDVHNKKNVYIAPFVKTEEYIPHPATDDHLVYGGYNGDRVFLMNRATFVPVSEIGQFEVIQRDYPDARMLQKHMSDLVNNMVCEVKEPAPPRLRGGSLPKEDEG